MLFECPVSESLRLVELLLDYAYYRVLFINDRVRKSQPDTHQGGKPYIARTISPYTFPSAIFFLFDLIMKKKETKNFFF